MRRAVGCLLASLSFAALLDVPLARAESPCAFQPTEFELRRPDSDRFESIGARLSLPHDMWPRQSHVRFYLPPTTTPCWLIIDRVNLLGLTVDVEGETPVEFSFLRPNDNDHFSTAGFVLPVSPRDTPRQVMLTIDKQSVLSSRVTLVDLRGLLEFERRIGMVRALSVVVPCVIILLIGLFWLRLRDSALAAYLGFLASTTLAATSLDGTIYFMPVLREIAHLRSMGPILAVGLLGLALVTFFRTFLGPLDQSARRVANVLTGLFCFINLSCFVWLPYFSVVIMNLLAFSILITIPLLFWQAVRSFRAGHPLAIYFLIGWSLPLFVVPLRVIAEYGGVEWVQTIRYAPRWAFLLESMVFGIGLADRILRIRLERDRAEQERLRTEAALVEYRDRAQADALTGLSSRHAMNDELRRWEAENTSGSVMFIDIDHFKRFNDRYGHAEGDKTLRAVAAAVRNSLPGDVHAARYGGEEMVALLSGVARDKAADLAEKMRLRIIETVHGPEGTQVTVSIGIAERDKKAEMSETLARADAALYRAKSNGRNRVEVA